MEKRRFRVELLCEVECETFNDGKNQISEALKKKKLLPSKIISVYNRRTEAQNNALHLWFDQLAKAFFEAGLDVKAVIGDGIEHPWTDTLVKELIWRKVQESMYGKVSTTELDTDEITKIYDVINRHTSERFGIHIPFPSIESLIVLEEGKYKPM